MRRYPALVSPFVGLSDATDDQAWRELAALLGPGQRAAVAVDPMRVPADWARVLSLDGVQMVATPRLAGGPADEAVTLGAADVQEMLHVLASNRSAIALYERLGFVIRRPLQFEVVETPVAR